MTYKKNPKVVPGLINDKDLCNIREAVCVQVKKIYDTCKEKDCIEDVEVLFKDRCIQHIINKAINVKCRRAEVVDVYTDIEEVPFKPGFYTVDVKYFIKVSLDFFVPSCRQHSGPKIITRTGLVLFDKKVILFGSEGNVKIFSSHYVQDGIDKPIRTKLEQDNLPIATVEVAEPIALNAKIEDVFDKCHHHCHTHENLLDELLDKFKCNEDDFEDIEPLTAENHHPNVPEQRVVVSLGIFSIIKLVRLTQLLIPAFDFCIPNKECITSTDDQPCEIFDSIDFPFDQFYPPQIFDFPGAIEDENECENENANANENIDYHNKHN